MFWFVNYKSRSQEQIVPQFINVWFWLFNDTLRLQVLVFHVDCQLLDLDG